jgi:hypothetical protein
MAATGFTPIQLYRTTTASAVPVNTNLADGELAINTLDEKLYFKNSAGTVKLLASNSASTGTVSSVAASVPAFLSIAGSPITTSGTLAISYSGTALPVANGGTGVTTSTGTGNVVLSNSPTLVTPALGTPASGNLSNTTADGTNAVGYRNIPYVADKTSSYVLAVGDVGEVVGVGTGGSITIPNATFAAGDAVLVFNNTTGDITVTCTITTAYIAGTDADVASVTLKTRGVCNILFISGTVCVITGNVS